MVPKTMSKFKQAVTCLTPLEDLFVPTERMFYIRMETRLNQLKQHAWLQQNGKTKTL